MDIDKKARTTKGYLGIREFLAPNNCLYFNRSSLRSNGDYRSEIVGVQNHLKDADLHQFVNGEDPTPVAIHQDLPFGAEGVEIGVLEIPLQERPYYSSLSDLDLWMPNNVYIRGR